jgi:hypothetical protein
MVFLPKKRKSPSRKAKGFSLVGILHPTDIKDPHDLLGKYQGRF